MYRYFRQGARDGDLGRRGDGGLGPVPLRAAGAARRHRGRPGARTLLGHRTCPPRSPSRRRPCSGRPHPEGEVAMARAVAACRLADGGLEQRRHARSRRSRATGVAWWLQIYVTADRSATAPGRRAGRRGRRAAPSCSPRTPRWSARSTTPARDGLGRRSTRAGCGSNFPDPATEAGRRGEGHRPRPAGRRVAGRRGFGLPVVVKGVLHPADARRCVDAGAAAVWVSNHGGRQLDRRGRDRRRPRRRSRPRSAARPRCTSTGVSAAARTPWPPPRSGPGGLPRPPAAVRAGRATASRACAGCSPSSRDELVGGAAAGRAARRCGAATRPALAPRTPGSALCEPRTTLTDLTVSGAP